MMWILSPKSIRGNDLSLLDKHVDPSPWQGRQIDRLTISMEQSASALHDTTNLCVFSRWFSTDPFELQPALEERGGIRDPFAQMRRKTLLKSNDRASYILFVAETSWWCEIKPQSTALGRSCTLGICSRGSRSFGVSAWNFHEYSWDCRWEHLTIIANSVVSETLLTIFSNPCPARGLDTCCGFALNVLKHITLLSLCSHYSSTWGCNRTRQPTAEQLADQLKNSFFDILFHFVCFSSFPLQLRGIYSALC
jgi:hypothetical protein